METPDSSAQPLQGILGWKGLWPVTLHGTVCRSFRGMSHNQQARLVQTGPRAVKPGEVTMTVPRTLLTPVPPPRTPAQIQTHTQ